MQHVCTGPNHCTLFCCHIALQLDRALLSYEAHLLGRVTPESDTSGRGNLHGSDAAAVASVTEGQLASLECLRQSLQCFLQEQCQQQEEQKKPGAGLVTDPENCVNCPNASQAAQLDYVSRCQQAAGSRASDVHAGSHMPNGTACHHGMYPAPRSGCMATCYGAQDAAAAHQTGSVDGYPLQLLAAQLAAVELMQAQLQQQRCVHPAAQHQQCSRRYAAQSTCPHQQHQWQQIVPGSAYAGAGTSPSQDVQQQWQWQQALTPQPPAASQRQEQGGQQHQTSSSCTHVTQQTVRLIQPGTWMLPEQH